jgi:hypothetical protein
MDQEPEPEHQALQVIELEESDNDDENHAAAPMEIEAGPANPQNEAPAPRIMAQNPQPLRIALYGMDSDSESNSE